MTKALITGIGGSIGIHVMAHVMHNTNWDVVGIDSFQHHGLTDRINVMLAEHPEWGKRLRVFTHDLTAPLSYVLKHKLGKVDYIVNLASLSDVHESLVDPVPHIKNNVDLILSMLEYAREAKPIAFLQISTDEVYGPTDGTYSHKEWDPIVPSSPYSASKAAQEAIAISYWRAYGVPLVIVNLMNNFGEMQSRNKFPAIVQRKISKGERIVIHGRPDAIGSRCYLHSRNSADAFLYILRNTVPHAHVEGSQDRPDRYNIVGSERIDNVELARMISMYMGTRDLDWEFEDFSKARPGHDHHYGLDGTKIKALGWKAPVSLPESMKETVRWQQEHPEWLE